MDLAAWDPLVRALVTGLGGGTSLAILGKVVDRWLARGQKREEEISAIRREQREEIAELKADAERRETELDRTRQEKLAEMKLRVQAEAQLELLRVRLQQAELRGEDPSRPGWNHELPRERPRPAAGPGAAGGGGGEDY